MWIYPDAAAFHILVFYCWSPLTNTQFAQTPTDCLGWNNCTKSSSNCLGNHSYDNYWSCYVKYPAWISIKMSSQMFMTVPGDPQYQRRSGHALPSYFYTHKLSNICTNLKAGGFLTPSWWNWPYTGSSNGRFARKHEACHILKAFSPKKSKNHSTFHWSLQLQGGSGSFFWFQMEGNRCNIFPTLLEAVDLFQMILGRFHSSKIEFSFCNYSVSFHIAWEIKPRLLFAFFNYRTSHKAPYKTSHKIGCMGKRDHLSGIERKIIQRVTIFTISTFSLIKNERK